MTAADPRSSATVRTSGFIRCPGGQAARTKGRALPPDPQAKAGLRSRQALLAARAMPRRRAGASVLTRAPLNARAATPQRRRTPSSLGFFLQARPWVGALARTRRFRAKVRARAEWGAGE